MRLLFLKVTECFVFNGSVKTSHPRVGFFFASAVEVALPKTLQEIQEEKVRELRNYFSWKRALLGSDAGISFFLSPMFCLANLEKKNR